MFGNTLNKRAGSEFESAYNYFILLKPRVMSLAIFTALVSTKDSPFSDDNKSLASAWFVFSIFVVISQIVSQVTTKGEKAMKFVKYLAREFGAMDKSV